MKENHRKLLNSVIKSIDWESVLKVHQSFNYGVGMGNFAIPGLRRNDNVSTLSIKDLKHELRSVIKYMIINEIPSLQYVYWHIFWTNDEWDFSISLEPEDEEDLEDEYLGEEQIDIEVKARLEVLYCPQRIMLIDSTISSEPAGNMEDDEVILQNALKRAVESENYEKAAEIQKLLNSLKK